MAEILYGAWSIAAQRALNYLLVPLGGRLAGDEVNCRLRREVWLLADFLHDEVHDRHDGVHATRD